MLVTLTAETSLGQVTGSWNVNAAGNWSATANWAGGIVPGLSTNPTGGVDDVANFINNITANRIITIDAAVPGSQVVLGTLNVGDSTGGQIFTITGGTLTFDVSAGNAQLNMVDGGGGVTISSAVVINDLLNLTVSDITNSQGITISGKVSGGTAGTVTMQFDDLSAGTSLNWLILNSAAGNDFAGQIVMNSGLVRFDGANSISHAGAVGVGNETIAQSGGGIDLRDHDFHVAGDNTEIFKISGTGPNGLGVLRNTSGTGIVSHVSLDGDVLINSQTAILLERRMNSAGTGAIAPILDFGGHTLTKVGAGDFYIRGGDLRNTAGVEINIHEGEIRFENRGALTGGGAAWNQLDGLTFNISYNRNPYDNADLANGSRTTSDLFGLNSGQTVLLGNSVVQPRLSLGTFWGEGVVGTGGNPEQTKITDTFDNVIINLNNGVIQREGNAEAGRTFDQILGPNVTINLVGGGVGRDNLGSGNLFDINGGSGVINATTGSFDHPGVMELQGKIDNTSGANAGTGFTVRGSRELRLTGSNATFDGDVLVKLPTNRWIGPNYNVPNGALESTYTNLSLAGAAGTLNQANSITLTRMGSMALLNNSADSVYASSNHNNRLNDNGALILRNGLVKLETDATVTNSENLGNVIADIGTNFLFLDTRAGGTFDGALQSFVRNDGGILKILNMNPGHTWGTQIGDDRMAVVNTTGIVTSGTNAPGTPAQNVVLGLFGGVMPTLSVGTGAAAQRSVAAAQNAYAFHGVGLGMMTLDGGYLRPLTASEYSAGSAPVADTNWLVNSYLGTATQYTANRDIYEARNVTANSTVNSLTIAFDPNASGQAIVVPVTSVDTSKDYVVIETGATLTINSGIINFATLIETTNANTSAVIRGGSLDMNGRQSIINSALTWHDLDSASGTGSSFMTGNNAFIRSHIVNADGLVKTGRNNLYLESWNDISGNVYISDQGSLVIRHAGALGGAAAPGDPRREVVVGGTGNFLLEYGVNVQGLDIRATNTFDSTRVVLRNEGASHSSWAGNVIIDGADAFGSANDASYSITARTDGTLTVYGDIFTANNVRLTDDDAFADPPLVTTSIGETYTLNLRGQFKDVATGNLGTENPDITSLFRTGDSATRLDSNHSLRFQMSGHDEGNVNAHQPWDATGRLDLRQGYFRVLYDPSAPGATGFYTDGARSLLLANDYYNRIVLGADGTSTTSNYHSHLTLVRDGQVFNAPFLYAYNDNRQGTQTIGGENDSGTVYFGSHDNSLNFGLQYANQSAERDVRFLQVRGGNMVFNGRLDDENNTVDSFSAVASIVGPGTVTFNANAIGNSDIDRWNFLGGTTHWVTMTANNQFARTAGTNGSRSGFGGGSFILDAQTVARTQTLDGNIYLMGGAGSITTGANTTLTLGGAARTLTRNKASSLAFSEDGNSVINFSATGLPTTAGAFLGAWGVYGNSTSGITDWAARQATTGVQAFAAYANDTFGVSQHTNLTGDVTLPGSDSSETLRFGAALTLEIGAGNILTLNHGGVLIPATVTGDVSITGGSLTSAWTTGGGDLLIHNHGSGRTTIGSVIADDGGSAVNLIHSGNGTLVLQADNSFTGDFFLNGGVVEISSEEQLGDINGSVARLSRVNNGGSNGASLAAGTPFTVTGGGGGSGLVATFQTDANQTIAVPTVISNGGSGYTSGLYLNSQAALTGTAGVWAILDSGNLHFNGGTLRVTESLNMNPGRTIFLGANGGTLEVGAGRTLTINGYITSEFSHATPANGFTTINHSGTADEPASSRNPDIGDLIIQGGGTVILTGSPDGVARANMFNSYGGITWINDGILRISSTASAAAGILGTNRSWIDGTVIGSEGTLMLNTDTTTALTEWFTFRGQGHQDRGTIQTMGTGRAYRFSGQLFLEDDVLINNMNGSSIRFNETGGAMYGSGDIKRLGTGILYMYGNSPDWTGSIVNGSGDLYTAGAGNLQGMADLTLERNSIYYYEAGSASIDEFRDRLNDNLTINTDGYVRMRLRPSGGVFSGEERVGTLNVLGGQVGLEFDIGADLIGGSPRLQGDYGLWSFTTLARSPGTSVHLRSLDSGVEFAHGGFGATQFGNVVGVKVNALPTSVGSGSGLIGDAPVVPGMFGGVRPAWTNLAGTGNVFSEAYISDRLVTFDTLAGGSHVLRPLLDSEYTVFASPNTALLSSSSLNTGGLNSNENLKLVGVTTDVGIGDGEISDRRESLVRLSAGATINSLTLASESYINGTATGRGNFTALTIAPGAELTINSGMVVSASRAIQNRNEVTHSTSINADIRNAINGGSLNFNDQDAHFNLSDIWVHYNTSASVDAYQAVDVDNALLYLNSTIKNANHLIKTGPGPLFVQSANEYSGDTYIDEGLVYARNDFALGTGSVVNIQGGGGLVVGHGVDISGKTILVGKINGNNLGLALQEGASWTGNIVIDNVDSVGGASFARLYTPRIYNDQPYRVAVNGDVHGGTTTVGSSGLTDARMFTTYDTGADGILQFRGRIRDSATGAFTGPVNFATANQVLRMEVVSDNNGYNVELMQQHDAAGRIRLLQGVLVYGGEGNFYTTNAAATVNANLMHPMLGFQMGGRSVVSSDGDTAGDSLAFFLANAGSTFNLSSWEVGVETYDPENLRGNDNYGRGNTTGNSTLGGLNSSGESTFGMGDGTIFFTQSTRQTVAYDRDLRLFSMPGGEVTLRANLVDGGDLVNSSITKIGGGQVNLQGSSTGGSSVEGVHVLGGTLVFENYGANPARRVGNGANLILGGGILAVDGLAAAGAFSEDFGNFRVNTGGSAIAAIGANTTIAIAGSPVRAAGGQVHFQSVAGGVIRLSGVPSSSLIGAYATFGSSLGVSAVATDWAATDGGGNIVAFSGYAPDAFGAGNHTDVVSSGLTAAATESIRFNNNSGEVASGSLTLGNGGLLVTSNYAGGTPVAAGVTITTPGAGTDLILHNFSPGAVSLAGNIEGPQNVVFNGTGDTFLSGTNSYLGATYITGAATVVFDDASRFGSTSSFNLNGGGLNYLPAAAASTTITDNFVLGGNDGVIQVGLAGSRLILRGAASNQFVSEANVISAYNSNPYGGGLTFLGPGTIQFGNRSAAAATTDVLGVVNSYTGLSIIGDGTNTVRVDIQGQGVDNEQYTPFGTHESWADGTVLRNNAVIEFSIKRGDTSRDGQIRLREWFQIGEQAGDQVLFDGTTSRQPTIDGQVNLIGTLTVNARNAGYADGGTVGNSEFLFNPNEGGVYGDGDIIKMGDGNLRFYQPLRDWTGDLDIHDGFVGVQSYQTSMFEPTGSIIMGDPNALETSAVQMRVEPRFGNSTTQLDSGTQNIEISRDIIVRDGIKQAIRISVGYSPEATFTFSGNIHVGSGSTGDGGAGSLSHVRFYNEDTTGMAGYLTGHSQHVVMAITGNLSGSNNVMLEANEGGSANDDVNDQFTTFFLAGDNSAFTGRLSVGSEVGIGTANFDRDDIEILRFGSDTALTVANFVEMRNLSTMQLGGRSVAIGGLTTIDGNSTSGIYSFAGPTWDPTRRTTADLSPINVDFDATSGTLHGGTAPLNYTPLGGSSAIIENASSTPGTLRINQDSDAVWDAHFRDGVPDARFEPGTVAAGSLSLEKLGTGSATLSIFNTYTGTTSVVGGVLQVGVGGNGEWATMTQDFTMVSTATGGGTKAVGSTGTGNTWVDAGATLSGSGHVRGNLDIYGTLSPGDTNPTFGVGRDTGTLFIGNRFGTGDLTIHAGAVVQLQAVTTSTLDSELFMGTYTIEMGGIYEDYISSLPDLYIDTVVNPTAFGQSGTGVVTKVEHDHLEVGGDLTWLDGTIQLAPALSFAPNPGDIYNLIDWYGVSDWSAFDIGSGRYMIGNGDDNGDLNLPDLSAFDEQLRWDAGLWTSHGILVIAIAPEPTRALLTVLGLALILFRRRRC